MWPLTNTVAPDTLQLTFSPNRHRLVASCAPPRQPGTRTGSAMRQLGSRCAFTALIGSQLAVTDERERTVLTLRQTPPSHLPCIAPGVGVDTRARGACSLPLESAGSLERGRRGPAKGALVPTPPTLPRPQASWPRWAGCSAPRSRSGAGLRSSSIRRSKVRALSPSPPPSAEATRLSTNVVLLFLPTPAHLS